ncbi:MAG: DUF421 domain-containing protein [Candidatus Dependentiae bacterium]
MNWLDIIDVVLGTSHNTPTFYQMIVRALVIYFVAIFLIRLGKRRVLQPNSPFDIIFIIIIGNILADAIVGSWPFFECLGIMILLFVVHSAVSALTFYFQPAENLFEGAPYYLIKNGIIDKEMLRTCHINYDELMSAVRRHAHTDNLEKVKHAILETNGDISIILQH